MDEMLQIVNVNKIYKINKYDSFQALHNITVSFDNGELVSIVGESGSGKSTLMNLIGGLDSDFTGKIIVNGQNIGEFSDKQLDRYRKDRVGFVFQSFNLISHLSILDNVTLALTLSNVSEKEKVERATKILKLVGLESQIKKKPTQLSGGQKQRVAIARALINNPSIIIADEPTGSLDTTTTAQILKILKEIADSGKLVIMVTHSEKVASISSRVVEISDGRIVSDKKNEKYKKEKVKFFNLDERSTSAKYDKEAKISDEHEEKTRAQKNGVDKDATSFINANVDVKIESTNINLSLANSDNTIVNVNILNSDKKEDKGKKKDKNHKKPLKQNLSFLSAIRLSLHNMWASKTKNLLMAFGVAIGIGSLILMLCFSSGITDYINNTMKSYSDPTIVTISKQSKDGLPLFDVDNGEITTIMDGINEYLSQNGYDFEVTEDNCSPGFNCPTISTQISAYFEDDLNNDGDFERLDIFYFYTTPPYYSEDVVDGTLPTEEGGIMFAPAVYNFFGDIDPIGEKVDFSISINIPGFNTTINIDNAIITGIVDTSVMSGFPIVYINYDFFEKEYKKYSNGAALQPTTYYIQTRSENLTEAESEEIASAINRYISTLEGYSGSIEESLANMFQNMGNTIGTSLIILSIISLIVSAIMILVVMYMSVTERTKEIGVLKSIGARKKDIHRIFSSESFLVGLLSGICGLIVAGILLLIIYLVLINLVGIAPLSFKWYYVFIALGVSVVISVLSGLYPASKAARLDPVESLRRE